MSVSLKKTTLASLIALGLSGLVRAEDIKIGVAEALDPGHPQLGAGSPGLPAAALAQRLAPQVVGGLAGIAPGAVDHDGPQPGLGEIGGGHEPVVSATDDHGVVTSSFARHGDSFTVVRAAHRAGRGEDR